MGDGVDELGWLGSQAFRFGGFFSRSPLFVGVIMYPQISVFAVVSGETNHGRNALLPRYAPRRYSRCE